MQDIILVWIGKEEMSEVTVKLEDQSEVTAKPEVEDLSEVQVNLAVVDLIGIAILHARLGLVSVAVESLSTATETRARRACRIARLARR